MTPYWDMELDQDWLRIITCCLTPRNITQSNVDLSSMPCVIFFSHFNGNSYFFLSIQNWNRKLQFHKYFHISWSQWINKAANFSSVRSSNVVYLIWRQAIQTNDDYLKDILMAYAFLTNIPLNICLPQAALFVPVSITQFGAPFTDMDQL